MSQSVSDPLATARDLTSALQENTQELRSLRRRYRIVLVLLVVVALTVGVVIKSRYDVRVSTCRQDNVLRSGLLNVADTLEADAGGELHLTGGPYFEALTPAMKDYLAWLEDRSAQSGDDTSDREDLVAELRKDFALQDCSNIPWI